MQEKNTARDFKKATGMTLAHFAKLHNRNYHTVWSEAERGYGTIAGKSKGSTRSHPHYSRWTDNMTNCNNTRTNKKLTLENKTQSMSDWSRELGINYSTLRARKRNGWTDREALTTGITYQRKS